MTIDPVEVASSTDHFVTLVEHKRREKRLTDWCSYFPTREEAKQHLVNKAQRAIEFTSIQLERAKAELTKAEAL